MKRFIFFASFLITLSGTVASCGNNENESGTVANANEIYACPMHPEVTSESPGNCHKCGMPLEKYSKAEHQEMLDSH